MSQSTAIQKPKRASRAKKTIVHLLLDMTGSMMIRKEATIDAFNEYIEGLKGDLHTKNFSFTLSQFNSIIGVKKLTASANMKDVSLLNASTYKPDGVTPLYDAIGRTIHDAEKEAKKNDSVLVIVQTDGQENASQEYSKEAVKALIKEKTNAGWQFVYLACELDAMQAGAGFGIAAASTMSYSSATSDMATSSLRDATLRYAATPIASLDFFGTEDMVDLRVGADGSNPSRSTKKTITQLIEPS